MNSQGDVVSVVRQVGSLKRAMLVSLLPAIILLFAGLPCWSQSGSVLNQVYGFTSGSGPHTLKIATLIAPSASDGDHLHIVATIGHIQCSGCNTTYDLLFGNGSGASSVSGSSNGFAYSYTKRMPPGATLSAGLFAYANADGSVDIYLWTSSADSTVGYTVLENYQEVVYSSPVDTYGATPSGTLVFSTSSGLYPPSATLDYSGNQILPGNIGIGTTLTPGAKLQVAGATGISGTTGSTAPSVLTVTGGVGGNSTGASTAGGAGGSISLKSGAGGNSTGVVGQNGADITIQGGVGGTGTTTGTAGRVLLQATGGNVGIGTSAPLGNLMVASPLGGNTNIYLDNNSGAQGILNFSTLGTIAGRMFNQSSGSSNGLIIQNGINNSYAGLQIGANKVGINIPGFPSVLPANTLDINGSLGIGAAYAGVSAAPANGAVIQGSVGIGTTAPGAKLEVNGGIKLTSGSGSGLTFQDGTVQTTAYSGSLSGTSLPSNIVSSSLTSVGTLTAGTWNASPLTAAYLPTNVVYADTNQTITGQKSFMSNVGIGTSTPGGNASIVVDNLYNETGLHVLNTNALGYSALRLGVDSNAQSGLVLYHMNNISYVASVPAYSSALAGFGTGGLSLLSADSSAPMRFYSGGTAASNERARITAAGYFGIGTTSPTFKLDVQGGQVNASGGLSINGTTVINSSGAWVGSSSGLVGPQGTAGSQGATGATGATGPQGATGPAGASPWVLSGSTASYNAGNVGIGTTTPMGTLDVGGAGGFVVSNTNLDPNGGYNLLPLAGSGKLLVGWNRSGGSGEQDLISNRNGGGTGGFSFYDYTNSGTLNFLVTMQGSGNVGVGTTAPGAKLEVNGNVKLTTGSGASMTFPDNTVQSTAWNGTTFGGDYAESVDVSAPREDFGPGDVLIVDPDNPGKFLKSSSPYSTLVAGIYSTKPGLVGRRQSADPKANSTAIPMAMVGIVPTKVTAENGPIKTGDILVASSVPGHAMKGTDRSLFSGAIVGKALGKLETGTGVIEVLISLQ